MSSIAQTLVDQQVVRTNFEIPYVWTSGIHSPIYCDCRELISIPSARAQVVQQMLDLIRERDIAVDAVAGTATAGIPWAAWVAEALDVPMLYVRSKPKGHGAGKMVEGRLEKNKNILVVEDAISTGGSSAQSVQALRRELDGQVGYVMAIFSWETPLSTQTAAETEVEFLSLTGFTQIAQVLLDSGQIDQAQYGLLSDFHDDPAGFSSRFG